MPAHDIERYRAAERRLWQHYRIEPIEHEVLLQKVGTRIRLLEFGRGDPILFVHGSPNAGPKWAPLVAQLGDFRCFVLDRPGCGLSEPVDYDRIDLRTFGVDLLEGALDGLHLERAAVVASSLGGALAFYFTRAHPERVVRLVQEGCPALVAGFRVPFFNVLSSALSLLMGWNPSSREAFRHLGHATSLDQGRFETEVLVWRDALLAHTETMRHENQLTRHLSGRMGTYRYGPEFLRQVTPATLYLWGESDPFGGVEIGQRSALSQPNAVLKSFPDSGHLPWLDDPATHARLVRDFLCDAM